MEFEDLIKSTLADIRNSRDAEITIAPAPFTYITIKADGTVYVQDKATGTQYNYKETNGIWQTLPETQIEDTVDENGWDINKWRAPTLDWQEPSEESKAIDRYLYMQYEAHHQKPSTATQWITGSSGGGGNASYLGKTTGGYENPYGKYTMPQTQPTTPYTSAPVVFRGTPFEATREEDDNTIDKCACRSSWHTV